MSENRWSDVITSDDGDYVGVDEADDAVKTVVRVYENALQKTQEEITRMKSAVDWQKATISARDARIAELEGVLVDRMAMDLAYFDRWALKSREAAWENLNEETREMHRREAEHGRE